MLVYWVSLHLTQTARADSHNPLLRDVKTRLKTISKQNRGFVRVFLKLLFIKMRSSRQKMAQ